jgi:hypothetical protein
MTGLSKYYPRICLGGEGRGKEQKKNSVKFTGLWDSNHKTAMSAKSPHLTYITRMNA